MERNRRGSFGAPIPTRDPERPATPMTGAICFARNNLRIELWHLVVAPGVPKSRNGSFESVFPAFVHCYTQPRLKPRHE
jgi:hypothetical protein